MSREAGGRRREAGFVLLALVFLTLSCGKKGDPQPPLPKGPNAVSDLSVEQEGDDAVLTFRFPDRLLTGAPLTDLADDRGLSGRASALLADLPASGGKPGTPGRHVQHERRRAAGRRRAARGDQHADGRGGVLPAGRKDRDAPAGRHRRAHAGGVGRLQGPALTPLCDGEEARAARLRRHLGAARRGAQPAFQHRGARSGRRARGAGPASRDAARGAHLPRLARAAERRARPAGRDRRLRGVPAHPSG